MVATIYLNQQQRLINTICKPLVESMGYLYVGCDYLNQRASPVIRVYIDKVGGTTIDDCALISQQLGILLDTQTAIDSGYSLEVSSPGVERVLFSLIDFNHVINQDVLLYFKKQLDGRSKMRAKLVGIDKNKILLMFNGQKVVIPLSTIKKANLMPLKVE